MTETNSNVIFYMKLMHELKAEYPNVPDEVVKDTVIKFGGNKELCKRDLSSHSKQLSRSKRKVEEGKFYAQRGKNPSIVASSSLLVSSTSTTFLTTTPTYGGEGEGFGRRRPPKCSRSCRENPYSKVFARRKMFYQKFCEKDGTIEEDSRFFSSSNLVWRRKCSLCDDSEEDSSSLNKRKKAPDKSSSFITLNANIQPFAPFVIRHDSEGTTPGALSLLNSLNHLHLDSSGHSSMGSSLGANSSDKMEMSVDGGKVHYATSTINSEEGVESHLEVSLGKTESFITTTHTDLTNNNLSNSSSSIFHLQYEEGGKVLNITSNFNNNSPDPKRRKQTRGIGGPPGFQYSRPVSLNLNSLFAHGQAPPRPSSAYCTQLHSSAISPRYNSLPNLNSHGVNPLSCYYLEEFQSNPADEEKRLAYTRALLTHQMEQYLKLDGEIRLERSKLNAVREEIALMEERRNKKRLVKLNAQVKRNEGLEKDIKGLRYSCDTLAAKVTKITKGKIPLGETSIEFYQFLSPKLSDSNKSVSEVKDLKEQPPFHNLSTFINALDQDKKAHGDASFPKSSSFSPTKCSTDQWACTECTFLNHPALTDCEECEMPRFSLGPLEQNISGTSQAALMEGQL